MMVFEGSSFSNDALLHVGAARTIITPPVGFMISGPEYDDRVSIGVNDDLLARCLAVESYGVRAVLVSLDVWGVAEWLADRIRDRVAVAADVESDDVLVVCSGNGVSPPLWRDMDELLNSEYAGYVGYLPDAIGGVARNAVINMSPGSVGSRSTALPNVSCYVDGVRDADAEDAKASLPVMSIEDECGRVKVLVASFGCPGTVLGDASRWSAEYGGVACWGMEQSGADMGMFIHGVSSDVSPFDWWDSNRSRSHADRGFGDVQALGLLVATQAAQATNRIQTRRNAVVNVSSDLARGVQVMRVGNALIVSVRQNQPMEFASRIRSSVLSDGGSSGYESVFVSGNNRIGAEASGLDGDLLEVAVELARRVGD